MRQLNDPQLQAELQRFSTGTAICGRLQNSNPIRLCFLPQQESISKKLRSKGPDRRNGGGTISGSILPVSMTI